MSPQRRDRISERAFMDALSRRVAFHFGKIGDAASAQRNGAAIRAASAASAAASAAGNAAGAFGAATAAAAAALAEGGAPSSSAAHA